MGGMFDPVHNGHLGIASATLSLLKLDALVLLPCGQPVHGKTIIASCSHRLAMLRLATRENSSLLVDDRECRVDSPSYAFDSLQAIRKERPETRLYYLMGRDAFNSFHSWYRWQDIFSLAHIVVAARPGYDPVLPAPLQQEFNSRNAASVEELKASQAGRIHLATLELSDLSSTTIRERLARNEAIDGLVPANVAEYIHANKLYTPETRI